MIWLLSLIPAPWLAALKLVPWRIVGYVAAALAVWALVGWFLPDKIA